MHAYYIVLLTIYMVFIVAITLFIGWSMFKTRRISDKVVGALALIMFILRILMIK